MLLELVFKISVRCKVTLLISRLWNELLLSFTGHLLSCFYSKLNARLLHFVLNFTAIGCWATLFRLLINMARVERLILTHVLVVLPKSELRLRQTSSHLLPFLQLVSRDFMLVQILLVRCVECCTIVAKTEVGLSELCSLVLDLLLRGQAVGLFLLTLTGRNVCT